MSFIDNILADKVVLSDTEKESVKNLEDGSILLHLSSNATNGEYNVLKNFINKYNGNGYEDYRDLCLKVDGNEQIVVLTKFNYTLGAVKKIEDIMVTRSGKLYIYDKKSNEFNAVDKNSLIKTLRISREVVSYGIN